MERFVDKVLVMPTGCWDWQACTSGGYGQITIGTEKLGNKKLASAHRVSYNLFVGPIPEGLQIDHLCRNRGCVNPDHLEPVTARVNQMRGDTISSRAARKTHCPQGHAYDDQNTYRYPDGRRSCRACNRLRYHAKKTHGRFTIGS